MDEPTNHLDIVSKEILESALNRYEGTVFFVSHDRYFINKTATRILNLTGKTLINYIGNYDYYLEKREAAERAYLRPDFGGAQNVPEIVSGGISEDVSAGKADWKAQKEEQARERKKKNRIDRIESEIGKLEERLAVIDEEYAKPEVATNSARLNELGTEQAQLQEKLDTLYEEWEALAEE